MYLLFVRGIKNFVYIYIFLFVHAPLPNTFCVRDYVGKLI